MRLELKIIDDNGDILAEHTSDAYQPSTWRPPAGSRFVSNMPRQSEQPATGTYELFGITVQPRVRVDRPNGYVEPPQIPLSGNTSAPPQLPPFASRGIIQTSSTSSLSGPKGL